MALTPTEMRRAVGLFFGLRGWGQGAGQAQIHGRVAWTLNRAQNSRWIEAPDLT